MGLPNFFLGHLPSEEVDEPEGEGVWPHVAQVGEGVEEGHVGAPDAWVRNASKECHRGDKPDIKGT